jgi:hypothetical protein
VPTPASIELKRHYHELSEKETNEVVETVADLIVNFLKGKRDLGQSVKCRQERTHDRNVAQPPESH